MENPSLSSIADANLIFFNDIFGGLKRSTKNNTKYYYLNTGLTNNPFFNAILLPNSTEITEIAEMEKSFRDKKLSFEWWLDYDKLPSEAKNYFQKPEYHFFGKVPGMVLDPNKYVYEIPKPNFRIAQIDKEAEFKKWCEVVAQGFSFGDDVVDIYLKIFSHLIS